MSQGTKFVFSIDEHEQNFFTSTPVFCGKCVVRTRLHTRGIRVTLSGYAFFPTAHDGRSIQPGNGESIVRAG